MTTVYVVGRAISAEGPKAWEFQGVFSSLKLAEAACRDETYFVGPAEVDQELPHETTPVWPGAYYPKG